MKKVAITGNIGSGKSWVCQLFTRHLDIPVYGSDEAAKRMYFVPEVKEQLLRRFGNDLYLSENALNKPYIANLIFGDDQAQRDLEGILYPAVLDDFARWAKQQTAPYVLFESALVLEKHLERHFDAVVMVSASEETRLRRAMLRDRCDEASVRARMAKQWPESWKRFMADFVIDHENDDEDEVLLPKLRQLHETLCSL